MRNKKEKITIEDVRETVARGWDHPLNENIEMDIILIEAIVEEIIMKLLIYPEWRKGESKS